MRDAVRVMIVDDHPLWRQTLRNVLEHECSATIVAEASDGDEAVELAARARPDVVVMDMELPTIRGPEATRRLTASDPDARVLILSSHDARDSVMEAIIAGARGYLVKTADATEIAEAVGRIRHGEVVFPSALSNMALAELRKRP